SDGNATPRMDSRDFQFILSAGGDYVVQQGDPMLYEIHDWQVPKRERQGIAIEVATVFGDERYVVECAIPFQAGGLHNDNYSSPILENCRFSNNRATSGGGGMLNTDDSDPVLANCLFTRNKAWNAGGALRNEDGSPKLINCILYGESTGCLYPELGNDVYSHPQFSCCNIMSCGGSDAWMISTGTDDGGNIDEDPLWLDEGANNFQLLAGSPCIDAGNNIDIYDLDGDADITELLPVSLDYYDNPRFADDPATSDTGNGTAPIIDMGVHEF
ncbi:MAG: right-handed parallel beta-helix repeat-containing protein, partial [bacterium]